MADTTATSTITDAAQSTNEYDIVTKAKLPNARRIGIKQLLICWNKHINSTNDTNTDTSNQLATKSQVINMLKEIGNDLFKLSTEVADDTLILSDANNNEDNNDDNNEDGDEDTVFYNNKIVEKIVIKAGSATSSRGRNRYSRGGGLYIHKRSGNKTIQRYKKVYVSHKSATPLLQPFIREVNQLLQKDSFTFVEFKKLFFFQFNNASIGSYATTLNADLAIEKVKVNHDISINDCCKIIQNETSTITNKKYTLKVENSLSLEKLLTIAFYLIHEKHNINELIMCSFYAAQNYGYIIAEIIKTVKQLRHVKFEVNVKQFCYGSLNRLNKAIANATNLKNITIIIVRNYGSVAENNKKIKSLLNAIKQNSDNDNSNLKEVSFSQKYDVTKLEELLFTNISSLLKKSTTIKSFNTFSNKFAFDSKIKLLSSNTSNLTSVSVELQINKQVIQHFKKLISIKKLKEINISFVKLGTKSPNLNIPITAFKQYKHNKSLLSVTIVTSAKANNTTKYANKLIPNLLVGFLSNTKLLSFTLKTNAQRYQRTNTLTDEFTCQLFDILKSHPSLLYFNFPHNKYFKKKPTNINNDSATLYEHLLQLKSCNAKLFINSLGKSTLGVVRAHYPVTNSAMKWSLKFNFKLLKADRITILATWLCILRVAEIFPMEMLEIIFSLIIPIKNISTVVRDIVLE